MSNRDDFSARTKDILAKRVGYRCSNPDCRKPTIAWQTNPQKTVSIGVASHITAAAPGWKRYSIDYTNEQRKDIDNGIRLCQNCAKLIDSDETKYSIKILYLRKTTSEEICKKEVEKKEFYKLEDDAKHTSDSRFNSHNEKAIAWLKKLEITAYMEIKTNILQKVTEKDLILLKSSAKNSIIKTFWWPIGNYIDEPKFSPKPDVKWIHTEIDSWQKWCYDYRALNKSCAFYLKSSLFEDKRDPEKIFFNTRIVRITEVLMYLKNLYSNLWIWEETPFEVTITHGWLNWRILWSSSPNRFLAPRMINTDQVSTTTIVTINKIENNIIDIVELYTKELFEQFDFFELSRSVLEDIVSNFVSWKVV